MVQRALMVQVRFLFFKFIIYRYINEILIFSIDIKTGNNFTCACMKGMVGALCDTPYCLAEPCKHGECNTSLLEPYCQCDRGYTGRFCEEDIDDCILPTGDSPCLHDGQCTDEVDKYNCNCTGTGHSYLIGMKPVHISRSRVFILRLQRAYLRTRRRRM